MSQSGKGALFRPWLWLPSQWAHDLAPYTLPLISPFYKVKDKAYRSFQWRGLSFINPLGVAGGVDKSGRSLSAWQNLGAGFLEVGTVTPEPQAPNPGSIMARDLQREALWNKMGFPNPGVEALRKQLNQFSNRKVPLFINIGKNRWTENGKAFVDYSRCLQSLNELADVFVVNVSSPNTKGLRDLLKAEVLRKFLMPLKASAMKCAPDKPLLLKLSPDMDDSTLRAALQESCEFVDGWILTNTTESRYPGSPFPADEGGVSGRPLQEKSLGALRIAAEMKGEHPEKLLVSVGGIATSQEVQQRLDMGADLVQVYSALVFQGPGFFGQILSQLKSH